MTYSPEANHHRDLAASEIPQELEEILIRELTNSRLFSVVQEEPQGTTISLDARARAGSKKATTTGDCLANLFLPFFMAKSHEDLSIQLSATLVDPDNNSYLLNKTYRRSEKEGTPENFGKGGAIGAWMTDRFQDIVYELIRDIDSAINDPAQEIHGKTISQPVPRTPTASTGAVAGGGGGAQQQQQMQGPTIVITGQDGKTEIKEFGIVSFESNPTGAGVYLDGSLIGSTPLLSAKLEAISYNIEIKKDGFSPWSEKVLILSNSTITIRADLVQKP